MLSLYVESQEWQDTECCHYYVESQEWQETECCHYMWNHKSGKRLNVVIICGITRVARY